MACLIGLRSWLQRPRLLDAPNSAKIVSDRGVIRVARERQPPGFSRKNFADEPLLLSWIRVFIFVGAYEAPR